MRKFLTFFFATLLAYAVGFDVGWAATKTATLTVSSLGITTTSYSGNYVTKTIDGITYEYLDLIKGTGGNSNYIQAKASTGVIYNTTAFPGDITSVAITHAGTARSTTISGSSDGTNWTQVATGTGSITGDFSDKGYKYFKITRGSNAAYWSQIVVTYSSGTTPETVATPTFSADGNTVADGGSYTFSGATGTVSLACATEGATIQYSTDGTNYSDYTVPITVSASTTIYAKATKSGMNESSVASATFNVTAPTTVTAPTFKIGGDTFTDGTKFENPVSLTITGDDGNSFYYTSGSSAPDDPTTSSTPYSSAISINTDGTYYYKAIASNGTNTSAVKSANFVVATKYGISTTTPTNGSLSTDVATAFAGDEVTITATPNTGYALNGITVTGNTSGNDVTVNNGKFTMPDEAVTVTATFSKSNRAMIVFDNSASDATNDVSAATLLEYTTEGASYVSSYSNIYKVYKGTTGIKFSSSKENGNVTINLSSTAQLPVSKIIVNAMKFGSDNASLSVNNVSTGALTDQLADYEIPFNGATLSSITLEATKRLYVKSITLVFVAAKAYNVTVTQATGGTITASPVGEKVVDSGDKITVTATPDTGYQFGIWSITGASESTPDANNQITATGNVTITATFTPISYTLSRTSNDLKMGDVKITDASGTELSTQPTSAAYGSTVYFKLFTKPGYVAATNPVTVTPSSLTVSGPDANNVYSFTMPAEEVSISAEFVAYHGTLKLAGHFNGQSNWREAASDCPSFTYNSSNDAYTITAYFTGIDDSGYNDFFFLLLDGVAKHPKADNGNYFIGSLDGAPMTFELSGGNSNNFGVAPGVYDIEINGALTSMKFTRRNYTMTFSPAAGTVNQGTEVTASCALATDIATIQASDSNAAGTVTMTGSPVTLSTVGDNQTVNATASIGNISVTGSATYNVQRENTSNKFYLVTNLSTELIAGKKYIIVNENNSTAYSGAAVGSTLDGASSITITDHATTIDPANVAVLTLGGDTDAWTFSFKRNNDTYNVIHTSASATGDNSMDASTSGTASTFSISLSSGTFDIVADEKHLRANTAKDFRFYANNSTGAAIQLYKQEEVKAYAITYAEGTNGSVSGVSGANADETVTVTVTPAENYVASGAPTVTTSDSNNPTISVTAVAGESNKYQFTVPSLASESTITVTPPSFEATYPITCVAEPAAGGTVTTSVERAPRNADVTVTATPNSDYQLVSVIYSWNNGASSNNITSQMEFLMPGYATTVTATFEKKPYNITVVSDNGTVDGLPQTAVSGQTVTFSVNANAGYVVSSVSGTFNNGSGTLSITDNGDGTYSFNMPASDVAITVTYFASEDYELLTNLADIVEGETYLIANYTHGYVMGKTGSDQLNGVTLDGSNYDSADDIISSTEDMAIVNFVAGTGDDAGKWAIHIADGYLGNGTGSSNGLSVSSSPTYATISLASDHRATIALDVSGTHNLLQSNGSLFKFYAENSNQANPFIYKIASTVKRPVIAGIPAVDQYLGTYNFIGKDSVYITCATEGASIEYSLDNGTTWTGYNDPFEITVNAAGATVPVQARATATVGGKSVTSKVASATFTCIKPQIPYFANNWTVNDTTYNNPMFIYPKRPAASNLRGYVDTKAYGADASEFYYSTDGNAPTIDAAHKVTMRNSQGEFIFLDEDVELQVVKVINGIASEPASGLIFFEVGAPEISLPGGPYDGDQTTRLSTATKTDQNNVSWTTKIYYTTGSTDFAIASDGTVTSSEWLEYDASTPISILVENSPVTLKAVTVANYYGGTYTGSAVNLGNAGGQWKVSDVSTATYNLTAANLDVIFSPAGGTYLYEKDVTLTPNNSIGNVTIHYTTDGTTASASSPVYTGPIHVGAGTTTISVYAVDSRNSGNPTEENGGVYTKSHTYNIGVQEPLYSPYPGEYSVTENGTTTYLYGDYYVAEDNATISVEIFDVSPDAEIHYTYKKTATDDATYDGTQPYPVPDTPTKASTKYDGTPINLEVGNTYVFSAIAYVGNQASTVRTRTFTVRDNSSATGSYWYSIKEMNEETQNGSNGTTAVTKTLANPVEVIYMNTYKNDGVTPEFAFVRDNSGYGYIYFGYNATGKRGYTIYEQGDWIKGMTIKGKATPWSSSFINEVVVSSTQSEWNAGYLDNRTLIPETTTCKDIRDGWAFPDPTGGFTGQASTATQSSPGNADPYSNFVTAKNIFGHYVHLRKNTITGTGAVQTSPAKRSGTITGEMGIPLCYYDGLYLFSGYKPEGSGSNITITYDESNDLYQDKFDAVQNKGGTFDVYAIVYFYGPYSNNSTWNNAPFEVFPLAFDHIFPPIFHLEGDASAADMTNHEPERTLYQPTTLTLSCETRGAQIWYKTSDMEAFAIYGGETINVDKTMTIETYSTHSTDKFDELESVVRTLTINMGQVPQPVISPESKMAPVVNGVVADGDKVTATIAFESGADVPAGTEIYFTVDGSDPADESNAGRILYTGSNTELQNIATTTTVRAIATADGFYSKPAEPRTYTFVKSNGIIYTLVESEADLTDDAVYVVVNREEATSMQRVQKDNNRDAVPVLFVTDDNKPTGHSFAGVEKEVFGNEDLAVFTLKKQGDYFNMHTANGTNNASIGFLYGNVSGATNQLLTDRTDDPSGRLDLQWTIEIGSDAAATMFTMKDGAPRYLRYNKSTTYNLFNTYASTATGKPVFLYKKQALPLATIEKIGERGKEYTVADEMLVVHVQDNLIWAKDENMSIVRREKPDGQIDYMREVARSGAVGGNVVMNQTHEWDQSNWVLLEMPNLGEGNDAYQAYKGQVIKATTFTGLYDDDVNYRLISSTETLDVRETHVDVDAIRNVYSTANFLDANLTDEGVTSNYTADTYFFVNPKIQEVAMITYAVYAGNNVFVAPVKYGSSVNGADLNGAFRADFTYNMVGNSQGTPTLTVGEAYQFRGVLNKVATTGGNAPRRIEGLNKNVTPDADKKVYALDLAGEGNIVTGVKDVNVKVPGRELEGIYNLQGQRVSKMEDGSFYILRYTDGTARKILK